LIWVLPDGFSPLFRPAAALPGPLLMPVLPVALPVVVPVVGGAVIAPLVVAPPVAELPAVPPPADCANAYVPAKTSAVANPNVASFMIAPFLAASGQTMPAHVAFQLADHGWLLFRKISPATIETRTSTR